MSQHVCSDCGESFFSDRELERHEERHEVQRQTVAELYTCPFCETSLQTESDIREHNRIDHGGR